MSQGSFEKRNKPIWVFRLEKLKLKLHFLQKVSFFPFYLMVVTRVSTSSSILRTSSSLMFLLWPQLLLGAVLVKAGKAVHKALHKAVHKAVQMAVHKAVHKAVQMAVHEAVHKAVYRTGSTGTTVSTGKVLTVSAGSVLAVVLWPRCHLSMVMAFSHLCGWRTPGLYLETSDSEVEGVQRRDSSRKNMLEGVQSR